jgi:hypothetical protein
MNTIDKKDVVYAKSLFHGIKAPALAAITN